MSLIPRRLSILAAVLSMFVAVSPGSAQEAGTVGQIQSVQSEPASGTFVELAPELIPTVVNISAEVPREQQTAGQSPIPEGTPFEDFFRDFFGPRGPGGQGGPGGPGGQGGPGGPGAPGGPQTSTAVGSGFIIDPAGYIVTNNHVVEGATSVSVVLHDETEYEAEIVGRDPRTDLALLKIDARDDLPSVRWGDSEQVKIGEPVLAIGNPFGLGGSATSGIISALARDLGIGPYDEFLQTDASINRGNSGGPLFNTRGEVIGVATAIFSPSGGNIGIGFATPSSLARSVVDQLRENGEVRRGWIGVAIQPVNEEIAASLGLDEATGALVAEVTPGSPAEQAGVQVGDVILSFKNTPIEERNRLPRVVADTDIGSTVPLTVWRDGEEVQLDITVGDLSEAPHVAQAEEPALEPQDREGATGLGLELAPLEPDTRNEFGISSDVSGAIVAGVQPDGIAAERGIRPGDVIMRAGQQDVTGPSDVEQAVREARESGQENILLLIRREGSNRFVALPLATG